MAGRLAVVLLLLTGGAAVTIAVAWACSVWNPVTADFGAAVRVDAGMIAWWARHAPEGSPDPPPFMAERRKLGSRHLWLYRPAPIDGESHSARRSKHGWPWLSLESSAWNVRPDGYVWRDAITSRSLAFRAGVFPVHLPLRPIWPGFALSAAFYALMLWMILFVPLMIRRRLRIRRGLCGACAYPAGTSPVCTECGRPHHRMSG